MKWNYNKKKWMRLCLIFLHIITVYILCHVILNKFKNKLLISVLLCSLKSSTYRVMPRLSICSASWIWILMDLLLFDLAISKYEIYSKQNISFLDFQREKLAHDSRNFWKRKLLCKNDSIKTTKLRSLNKIFHSDSNKIVKNTNAKEKYKNIINNINKKTLVDYNGPAIIEDLQNRSDQDFTNHIRVKRNVLMNDSIINHQWNYSINLVDSFPLVSTNFWNKSDAKNLFNKGSNLNADRKIQYPGVFYRTTINMPYSRHKRRILSRSKRHKKHAKGNIKQHTKIGNKKHGTLKSFQKSVTKKANSLRKIIKKAGIEIPVRTIDESQMESKIEKRESGHSSLRADTINVIDYEKIGASNGQKEDALLINNKSSNEQQNTVILPVMHTGKADLRVRIETILPNVSSFIINWTDRSIGTRPYSTISPKYGTIDEISKYFNVTNLEVTPNFDSTEKTRDDNLTMEITLKKSNYGNDISNQEINNFENTLYNSKSYSTNFNSLGMKDDSKNGKYDHANKISVELSDENMKSRAKRNQEITSKCYLRNDINTRSKRSKNLEQRTSIENIKHKKTRRIRGNRAVRSIGEIKELAEKLIVKVSELEIYINDRNEIPYVTDSCASKNANRTVVERTPGIFLEKQGATSSKTISNIDNRQHFAKNSGQVAEKRTFQMPSSGSRFARGENRMRRKPRRKWSRWMDWSSCSVTCGKGRQIRWRHCLRDCNDAETEMEEKACQLPACPPGKFLGIF